ncbi:YbjN domain-containing protein [Phenylobacterium sp.]|uniref:YbjN domain-containing protein n=1 Tax=Phenylobacterium sp. TaxID=1871053 RepID=UPI00391BA4F4
MALTAGPAAHAQLLPDGGVTAAEVTQALQSRGYKAEVSATSDGEPVILSGADGSNFRVFFYTCRETPRCASIQFAAAFDLDKGMTLEQINGWNRGKRFGRAYLDDEMDPFLEMDVDFEHGATAEAVVNALDTWVAVLPVFKEYVGF